MSEFDLPPLAVVARLAILDSREPIASRLMMGIRGRVPPVMSAGFELADARAFIIALGVELGPRLL